MAELICHVLSASARFEVARIDAWGSAAEVADVLTRFDGSPDKFKRDSRCSALVFVDA